MKFLALTSLTLDEFQRLIVPFEAAIQAHMAAWRLDRKPRTARRFTVYQNCPRPPPRIGHCLFLPMSRPTRRRPSTPVKVISQNEYPSCSPSPLAGEGWDGGGQARSVSPCPAPLFHPHPRPPPSRGRESRR
jgi:hypothetical protein